MRHKQRPVKSSRHKSVTFIIDSHTSFGDHNEAQQQQHANNNNQHHYRSPHHPVLPSMQHHNHQASRATRLATSYHGGGSASSAGLQSGSSAGTSTIYQQQQIHNPQQHSTTIVATNDDQPLLRKQFEHNYRHMSDVMRLAFLENNDISIDDCSNIDFNSLSTASILQRNIQQQLQQERRDQMQLRRQEQQQHRQQQQQQQQFHQRLQNQHRLQQQLQQQQHDVYEDEEEEEEEEELDNEYNDPEDFDLSDSRIFATATPTSSSNRNSLNYGTHGNMQQPGSSGVASHRIVGVGSVMSPSASGSRKRTRDSMQRVEFSDHVQVETIQNSGKGFFCDEPGCGKSFPSLRKLRHHKVVHSDEFPFVCEFKGCGKKFKRKFGIDLHSTTHFDLDPEMYSKTSNNSSLPFFGRRMQYSMCKPCGQKFKTVHEYQYHMLKHGKEPFKCPVKGCGQTFSIWKSFQKHRASHYFNYYCKMDSSCDHHTSNLQLLKLHIYCCHFRRKLPDNATLSSKDPPEDVSVRVDHVEVVDEEEQQQLQQLQPDDFLTIEETEPKPTISTPRRDSRLRKNPPRSSTFGQQDYASINNGSTYAKSLSSTPQLKKTRSTVKQQNQQPKPQQLQMQQQQHKQQQFDYDLEDDYSHGNDYEISDSGIFATATPTTSSSRNTITSTPKDLQRLSSINGKKRTKDSATPLPSVRVETQSQSKEIVRKYKDGFLCDEPDCGKSFPSLRKLRHHKVVHSDEFPFVCEFRGCGKKFKRKFGIDLHSTTHFDLDPEMYSKTSNNSSLPFFGRRIQYSMCKPCGQKFRTVHEYQYHMLKHGKEPFKCPVKGCGQTFGIWKSFQKHRASHYFNYYCKMDSDCDHHTSNLQLLKLHIYCCHFRRKLPDNATLSSKDPPEEEPSRDEQIDVEDTEDAVDLSHEEQQVKEEPHSPINDAVSQQVEVPTPRRDSRLRKNPPRSSAFGQQDYAAINNGVVPVKSSLSTSLQLKRTRATISSGGSQSSVGSQSAPPSEKKVKLPLKILPKRSAQRLPMSLIADDASTEDDEGHSSDSYSNERDDDDTEHDPAKRNRFKCHLCDYKFSVRFQLTKHLSTHLELTPEMYSATADKQVVQLSERRRREFYCDKCTVKFEHMPDLDTHMRKHGQRPYVCNFCQAPSTFRLAKQYLSHLYEHRFNYKCTMAPDCDFTINRKDALKLHIFRMHLNQQLPSYIENFANMIDCNEWSEQ